MKVSIKVANRDEANMVLAALADPEMFALVKIVGALLALQPRAQGRVLRWAEDRLAEEHFDLIKAEQINGGEPRLPGMG